MSPTSALLAALVLSAGADLQTLSGKKLSGELVGLDKQTLILRTPDGDVRHPVADVLQVELAAAEPWTKGAYYDVELTDGTVLHCAAVVLRGKNAELTVLPDLKVTVPLTTVFTILRDAQDARNRDDWQKFLAKRGRLDMVVVRDGEKLSGLDGTFGNGVGDGIEFTLSANGQKRAPKLAKVAGFIFTQKADPNAPPALCKVSDAAGNLLAAADLVLNDKGLAVTTVSGARIIYPDATRLAKLDFSKGKLTYLSDLTPVAESVEPRVAPGLAGETDTLTVNDAALFKPIKDKNRNNAPLYFGGVSYAKGLTLHAGTSVSYDIGGDYKELRAVLGVDESVLTESRAEVVFEGDGRELYRTQVSRKDPPRPVAVDVKGVQRLRVTVRSTGLLDLWAQASLADAKVSK